MSLTLSTVLMYGKIYCQTWDCLTYCYVDCFCSSGLWWWWCFSWNSCGTVSSCVFFFFALESAISSVLANHLHYEILFEESYYKDILTELVAFCCTRQWIGWFVFKVWLDHFVTLALQCLSPTMNINEN